MQTKTKVKGNKQDKILVTDTLKEKGNQCHMPPETLAFKALK